MAAQPTPPQTPTTTTPSPSPTLTAAQARALLQTLLSIRPNPLAPRPTPNTTTSTNASRPSSSPSKNQLPSSTHPTITIDASTRIMGHANKIRLPPTTVHEAGRIEEVMRAALARTPTGHQAARPVNITIQTGINLIGSRNVVVFGNGSADDEDVAVKDSVKARGRMDMVGAERVCEEGTEGRKRRAESEPVVESRSGKKIKVEREF